MCIEFGKARSNKALPVKYELFLPLIKQFYLTKILQSSIEIWKKKMLGLLEEIISRDEETISGYELNNHWVLRYMIYFTNLGSNQKTVKSHHLLRIHHFFILKFIHKKYQKKKNSEEYDVHMSLHSDFSI